MICNYWYWRFFCLFHGLYIYIYIYIYSNWELYTNLFLLCVVVNGPQTNSVIIFCLQLNYYSMSYFMEFFLVLNICYHHELFSMSVIICHCYLLLNIFVFICSLTCCLHSWWWRWGQEFSISMNFNIGLLQPWPYPFSHIIILSQPSIQFPNMRQESSDYQWSES